MAKETHTVDALAQALLRELPDRASQEQAILFFSAFSALVEEDDEVRAAFFHARENDDKAIAFLHNELAKMAEPAAVHALIELMRSGMMDRLPAFTHRLKELREDEGEGKEVTISSAAPLDEEERKRIENALEKKWKMPVTVTEETDPALIGGFRLRSGDWRFDASVKGKIASLAKKLKS